MDEAPDSDSDNEAVELEPVVDEPSDEVAATATAPESGSEYVVVPIENVEAPAKSEAQEAVDNCPKQHPLSENAVTGNMMKEMEARIEKRVLRAVTSKLIAALNDLVDVPLENDLTSEPSSPSIMHEFKLNSVDKSVQAAAASSAKASQEDSKQANEGEQPIVHPNIICDNCEVEIRGIRYKCNNCMDYDLCSVCEALPGIHKEEHSFVKFKRPVTRNRNDLVVHLDVDLPTGKVNGVKNFDFEGLFAAARTAHGMRQKENNPHPKAQASAPAASAESDATAEPSVRPKNPVKRCAEQVDRKAERTK